MADRQSKHAGRLRGDFLAPAAEINYPKIRACGGLSGGDRVGATKVSDRVEDFLVGSNKIFMRRGNISLGVRTLHEPRTMERFSPARANVTTDG
jgi:hypothetical protein